MFRVFEHFEDSADSCFREDDLVDELLAEVVPLGRSRAEGCGDRKIVRETLARGWSCKNYERYSSLVQ